MFKPFSILSNRLDNLSETFEWSFLSSESSGFYFLKSQVLRSSPSSTQFSTFTTLPASPLIITGTQNNDVIYGSNGTDIISGLGGVDIIQGNGGMDLLDGGDGSDFLNGGADYDYIFGGAGNDIFQSFGADYGEGGTGADIFYIANGLDGYADAGESSTFEGVDIDSAWFRTSGSLRIDGTGNEFSARTVSVTGAIVASGRYVNFEEIYDTIGDDQINATNLTGLQVVHLSAGLDVVLGHANLIISYSENSRAVLIDLIRGTAFDGSQEDLLIDVNHAAGSRFNDAVIGNQFNNSLFGGAGNDIINGNAGADELSGDQGNDYLSGGDGSDIVYGGEGNDLIYGDAALGIGFNDSLYGGTGDDTVSSGAGDDSLYGDYGNDRIDGGTGIDRVVYGGLTYFPDDLIIGILADLRTNIITKTDAGIDTLYGIEAITGTLFGDQFIIGVGYTSVDGSVGDDTFDMRGGFQRITLEGGVGRDTILLEASTGVVVDLTNFTATGDGQTATITAFEAVVGSQQSDNIAGTFLENYIEGGRGDDTLDGHGGNDELVDGEGNDSVLGGAGNDVFTRGAGNNYFDGGSDIDRIYYLDETAGIQANLVTGIVSTSRGSDVTLQFEEIFGSAFDDYFSVGAGYTYIVAGAGNDILDMTYGLQNITLEGNFGFDTLLLEANTGVDVDLIRGTATGDGRTAQISGFEAVTGSQNNDRILGDNSDNRLDGGQGDDQLNGGSGNDVLLGGAGNDILIGGLGGDEFIGGAGRDTFVLSYDPSRSPEGSNLDVIQDFTLGSGGDVLNVADILDDSTYTSSSNINQYLRFTSDSSRPDLVTLQVDLDGAAGAQSWADVAVLQGNYDAATLLQTLIQDNSLVTA